MRQRRLATVDVFVIVAASGGKQISADSPSSPHRPLPRSFAAVSCEPAGGNGGEFNPWVWVTVDRQRDNSGANTIIDSHLCPPSEIRWDYKRNKKGFCPISFCR